MGSKKTAIEIFECKKIILDQEKHKQKTKKLKMNAKLLEKLNACEHGELIIESENRFLKFLNDAKKYILVEIRHALLGAVHKQEFNKRKISCLTCHGRVDSIDNKTDPGGIGFCSLCGCGASKRAALSVKLTLAGVDCPLNKWKPVKPKDKIELNFQNIKEAGIGIFTSLMYQFKKLRYNFNFKFWKSGLITFRKKI